ncbi:MAG: NERD domain-containing protein [Methanobrevibacter sp.]|nr:NERD domain-containing protein [Methanobrevibacter sp.]
MQVFLLLPLISIILFVIIIVVFIFSVYSSDRFKNPEEYKDTGSAGERIIFTTLRDKIHVPEKQILRNVYIPTANGKTSEIDILVVSKKGLLVFECKNYAGNIYGDMKREKRVQYLGRQRNYFYNPFLQNRNHIKHLKKYLEQFGDLPSYSFVTTISRGKWKVRNLEPNDYFLGYNCRLMDIYNTMPDSSLMQRYYTAIINKLAPLSRPDNAIRRQHINNIKY